MLKNIKIAVIVGIRAQYMKLAAFQRAVNSQNSSPFPCKIDALYINSGQHYDESLSSDFLNELDIYFDVDFTGKYSSSNPINVLSEMIVKLYFALEDNKNIDYVIVFGDANTTLAGSIAATRQKIPLVHVESGLRTGNIFHPEEQNRIIADHLASVRFCSSKLDYANIEQEGLANNSYWSGDVIYDLVLSLDKENLFSKNKYGEYILVTIHREENVLNKTIMCNIIEALGLYGGNIIFITHPRTQKIITELDISVSENIKFQEGILYKDMIHALKNCKFVFTDSGALQRESYYLKKRCLIRQDSPFWKSLVDANIHRTVGIKSLDILKSLKEMDSTCNEMYPIFDDFGNGDAGKIILNKLCEISCEEM